MGQSFGLCALGNCFPQDRPSGRLRNLSGMRISASISIILLVCAEMIGANTGLAPKCAAGRNLMATDPAVAGVAILAAWDWIVSWLIHAAWKRLP